MSELVGVGAEGRLVMQMSPDEDAPTRLRDDGIEYVRKDSALVGFEAGAKAGAAATRRRMPTWLDRLAWRLVPKGRLEHILRRMVGEMQQQKRYLESEKRKLTGLTPWSEEWQTVQQAICNYTGRVWGLQIAIADLNELLA